jgi:hypothetical protein
MHPFSRLLSAPLVVAATIAIATVARADQPGEAPGRAAGTSGQAPLPPGVAPKEERSGISPAWFYVGLGAVTVTGALTVLSNIHALKIEERFRRDGCNVGATGPRAADCDATADAGKSATATTNILLGTTAAFVIATAVTGVVLVQWRDGTTLRATGAAAPGSAFTGLEVKMP